MVSTGVSVIVPWRPSPDREPVWSWLRSRWAEVHPDWEILEGSCPDGPWRKGVAVADGLARASHDVLVIADADVWCDRAAEAINAVRSGRPWAVAGHLVRRLSPGVTAQVLETGQWPTQRDRATYTDRPYPCHPGGGMTVLTRDLYEAAPIDPRFGGWGQEDDSWALALRCLAGKEWRGTADLWHLWHAPQERRNRDSGSDEGIALHRRYWAARNSPDAMRALLAETRAGVRA